MLTFSQSIGYWLEFWRCTNAVLTMAGRPDPRGTGMCGRGPRTICINREREAAALASQSRGSRLPGCWQKRLLTEIVTYNIYNSVLKNKTNTFSRYHVYHLYT